MDKLIMNHQILFLAVASLLCLLGCQSNVNKKQSQAALSNAYVPEDNSEFFQEVSPHVGVDFKHFIGDDHLDNLVETVGGGAAFLDYDQDEAFKSSLSPMFFSFIPFGFRITKIG